MQLAQPVCVWHLSCVGCVWDATYLHAWRMWRGMPPMQCWWTMQRWYRLQVKRVLDIGDLCGAHLQ
jgi:hypothetical protein